MLAFGRGLLSWGHTELLHLAQRVGESPALRYLAVLEALDGDAHYLHPIARSGAEGLRLPLVGADSFDRRHPLWNLRRIITPEWTGRRLLREIDRSF